MALVQRLFGADKSLSMPRWVDSAFLAPHRVGSFATVRLCTPTDADRASQQVQNPLRTPRAASASSDLPARE